MSYRPTLSAHEENPLQTAPDFEKVGQLRHVASSIFGVLAAFFCAVCLVYLSLFVVLPVYVAIMGTMTLMIYFGWVAVDSPATLVIVALAGTLLFLSGMVIGRFLLRAIPPRLSGERRKGVLGFIAALTIWYVISVFWFAFGRAEAIPSTPSVAEGLSLFAAYEALSKSTAFRILQFDSLVFWWLGFALPLLLRHWRPRRFLTQPFVLFLRRFSGFPDRTVQHAVLKHTPPGKPVAFLTPTGSRAGDWDPFRIGFAGIKFQRPIRSMPIILRSRNEDWKQAAKDLVDHAERIVLDLSEGSGAIQSEIDMIDAARRWPDVVILVQEGKTSTNQSEQLAQFTSKGASVVAYKRSWTRALPRLFFGLFASALVIVPLFYLLPMMVSMLTGLGVDSSDPSAPGIPLSLFVSGWYSLLVNFALYWAIYIILFVRPTLSNAAVSSLSSKLRARRA